MRGLAIGLSVGVTLRGREEDEVLEDGLALARDALAVLRGREAGFDLFGL